MKAGQGLNGGGVGGAGCLQVCRVVTKEMKGNVEEDGVGRERLSVL